MLFFASNLVFGRPLMKQTVITILLFFISSLCADESLNKNEKKCIYLCSRLTTEAKNWNDIVTENLTTDFDLFRPQDIKPSNIPNSYKDLAAYEDSMKGMLQSEILLLLPDYGRDCAWEIGWFCGQGKSAIAYVEKEGDWMRDAMVKGGLTAIITSNPDLYEVLISNASTDSKTYFISSLQSLGGIIKVICGQDVFIAL